MKKKILGIVIMLVAVLAITGVGSYFILNQEEAIEGGNVLDVAWYDINETEFTIDSVEEFYEFAKLSTYYNFKDQTVKLGADLVLNEGNAADWADAAPANKWTPIDGFGGVFDGQGHTISGVYAKGSGTTIALFSNTMGSAKIQNFELKNSYFESRGFGGVASISSGGGGNFSRIYSDAIITVKGSYSGYAAGIASKVNLKTSFNECWFDGAITTPGRNAGGIVDCIFGGVTKVSHCLFSGTLESTWSTNGPRIGGICGDVRTEGSSLELVDSLSTGTVKSAHASFAGSILGMSSSGTSLKSSDTYGSVASYKSTIGNGGSNGTIQSSPLEMPGENLVGVKAYQWTNLDFDKYWSATENSTPVLKHFAGEGLNIEGVAKAFDASWYSETASEGVISTVEQLYGFYVLSGNTNFKGKTIKLGSDIVFNEGKASDWLKTAPANVWYQVTGFAGTFDGQGHTISGLYMATDGRYVGFFKTTTQESNVKNFSIKNCLLINHCEGTTTAATTGSVAGAAHGKFENIYSDAILDVTGAYIGGMFGQIWQKTTVSNCWFDGKVTNSDGRYTGGVVGSVTGSNVVIEHCLNTGSVDVTNPTGYCNSGGICGATLASAGIVLDIKDCLNIGTVTSKQGGVGSIIGHVVSGLVNINDCYALNGSNVKDNKAVGHVQGGVKGGAVTLKEDMLTGYLAYDWTTLDYANYWAVVSNDTPVLKTWAKTVPSVAGRQKAFDISWYDATKNEYVIKNAKQLYGFYIMSGTTNYKGKTVKLGANIALNSGDASAWKDAAPKNQWFPIENFAGTFDGQGHTLSGIYINTGKRYCGFFASTTKDAVVKNFKLTNSMVVAEGIPVGTMMSTGSIAGAAHGRFEGIYTNAFVYTSGDCNGGMFGQVYQPTVISNCQFDGRLENIGRYSGGIVGAMTGQTLRIEHCLNSGYVKVTQPKSAYCNSGGIIGACYYTSVSLDIVDCLNVGTVDTNQGGTGSVLGHCVKGKVTFENTYAAAESNKRNGVAVGNNQDTIVGEVTQVPGTMLKGINGYRVTFLDFAKYWNAVDNTTPQLKKFSSGGLSTAGVSKLYDTSWYDANKTEFVLTTMEQLYGFAQLSKKNDFAGKTIKLGANITLNDGDAATWRTNAPANGWIPTGKFAGTFDGQGYTIKGLYTAPVANAGLFGQTTKDTVVKHLRIENSLIQGGTNAGSVAGSGGGTFQAIYSDAIVASSENQVGGIIGSISVDTTMELIQFNGWAVTERNQVGGLIGLVTEANVTMKNCHVSGTVETTTQSGHMNMGMAVGRVVGKNKETTVVLESCLLNGYVKHNHPGATDYDNRFFANRFVGKMEGKNAWLSNKKTVYIDGAEHWPTYVGHTQGSGAGSIWKDMDHMAFTKEALLGEKAWFNTKLDFYLNMTDMSTGKAWIAIENEMPLLRIFAENQTVVDLSQYVQADTSWVNDAKGTKADPYIIKDANDLAGLSDLVNGGNTFEDKFLIITADIIYNSNAPSTLEGWKNYIPKNVFKPIGQPGDKWNTGTHFAGTLDGQNHTISGIYVMDADEERWAGLFGAVNAACTIKNLKLMDSYIEGHQQVGAISGRGGGTFENIETNAIVVSSKTNTYVGNSAAGFVGMTHTDAIVLKNCRFSGVVKADNSSVGGFIGSAGGPTTITRCMFDGSVTGLAYVGGLVGGTSGATLMKDCHIAGTVVSTEPTEEMNTGMVVGRGSGSASLRIYSCLVNGYMNVAQTEKRNYANAYVGNMNGTNSKLDIQYSNIVTVDHMPSTCYNLTQGSGSWNGWAQGHTSNGVTDAKLTGATAVLYTKGLSYCANAEDTTGTWVATKEGTPKLRIFAEKDEIADVTAYEYESHGWFTSGAHEGTASDPYQIKTMGEFIGFQRLTFSSEQNFEGKYIALKADLEFNKNAPSTEAGWASYSSPRVWQQISNPVNQFKGTFDGENHSISGIYLKNTGTNVGLFGYTAATSTIKNLKVVNSYFEGATNVGGVTGSGGGTYENVYSNAIVKATSQYAGGMIGLTNANASFTRCHFAGEATSAGNFAGGITSRISSMTVNFTECLMTGKAKAVQRVGGFLGQTDGTAKIQFTDCMTTGTTTSTNTGHSQHGGFVGYALGTSTVEIARGVMAGKMVCANQNYTRPFVGKVEGGAQFSGADGAYLIQDTDYYPLNLGFIGTISLSSGNDGWLSSPGSGCARITEEQMTGENAVANMPKLSISTDKNGTSTWVATKNGFPTLRFFANEADILTK